MRTRWALKPVRAALVLFEDVSMPDPYAHYTPWGDRLLVFTAADQMKALACDRYQNWQSWMLSLGLIHSK